MINNRTVISADIVAFTSLTDQARTTLEQELKYLFGLLDTQFGAYIRLIKGDYLEIVPIQPNAALRIAIILKTFIKSLDLKGKTDRYKYFEEYGIRVVIGYGELTRFDPQRGIIDGEAIYLSGRRINDESTHRKQRVVIKNTLLFESKNELFNTTFNTLLSLLDHIIARATRRQSEITYHKLMKKSESEISELLGMSQSAVNQHSTSVGYNAIEKAILFFENQIK